MEFIIGILVGVIIFLFGVYCGKRVFATPVSKIVDKYSKYRDKKTGLLTPYKINTKAGDE